MAELRTETMTVNMGPQHPSTHGVLRLVLELDGEIIQSAMPTIGYLHTGIEKTAEQKKWQQVIPLVERMDYLAAQSNSLSYALCVEKLLGLEMPQRVNDIRVLLAELQRIASHLIWIGTHGLEIGAVSPEEIAVSVVAEMIAMRRNPEADWKQLSKSVYLNERLRAHLT